MSERERLRTRTVTVSGSPFSRGRQLGSAVGDEIHRFLYEGVSRLEWILGRTVDRSTMTGFINTHAAIIERWLPTVADEVHGLAQGAGISIDEAYLLQLRRELISHYQSGCTVIASPKPGSFLAQTIDLPGAMADVSLVIQAIEEKWSSLQLSFIGLLGYVGLNNSGVAIGINMLVSDGWRPGIPPYLIVRRLLELKSVRECLDELMRLPRASSRCYTLVDKCDAVQVETTCDQLVILDSTPLVHTNHYKAPQLKPLDRANVLQRMESRKRMERAIAEMRTSGPDYHADDDSSWLFSVLSAHGAGNPVCIHGNGDPKRPETVAAVVMKAGVGRMYVRRGLPCLTTTEVYDFQEGADELDK